MNEKIVKLCRNLAAVAMLMSALGNLIGADIGFDSLGSFAPIILVLSLLLMAGGLLVSNVAVLGAGFGLYSIYLALLVIEYIKWEIDACYTWANIIQAVGFVLLAVFLVQRKDDMQFIAISFGICVVGVCVGRLFYEGSDFGVKLSNCVYGISNLILSFYLPALMGMLTPKSNTPLAIKNPVAVSPVAQSANVDSFEKINKLKELLDMGAISQEDFDAKKKEILNL